MKLNIEELCDKAEDLAEERCQSKGEFHPNWHEEYSKELIRLVVERCAVECDNLQLPEKHNLTGMMPTTAWEVGTMDAAGAIRKLLED